MASPVSLGRRSAGEKPLLRGVSHQIAAVAALVASAVLVARAETGASALAAAVFGATMVLLFSVSALYHRVNWSPVGRQRMRRLDHAAIFTMIAGGYTPILVLVPSGSGGHGALIAMWIGAAVGVVKSLAWPDAPKWLTALLCVALGWMAVVPVLDRAAIVGPTCTPLLIASGLTYSAGALVYARKWPDPWPRVFGYHEVFHALVIVASALLFGHVVQVMQGR
jgi:hemolysin III